jgi:hypothetical protein
MISDHHSSQQRVLETEDSAANGAKYKIKSRVFLFTSFFSQKNSRNLRLINMILQCKAEME